MPEEESVASLIRAGEDELMEAAFRTGDFTVVRSRFSAALEYAGANDDPLGEAHAKDRLGFALHYELIDGKLRGFEPEATAIAEEERLFREALSMREVRGDQPGIAQSCFGLGLVFQVLRQDWSEAIVLFRRALRLVEELGAAIDLYTRSEIHRHIGFYYLVADVQLDRARNHLSRSLELRREMADPRVIPSGLIALGETELRAGDAARAVELLEEAVEAARQVRLLPGHIAYAEQTLAGARAALDEE